MIRRSLFRGLLLLLLLAPVSAAAQDELELTIRRDFGYRAGGRIQGRFTLGVDSTVELIRVRFEIDGVPMAEVSQSPFEHSFSTSEYGVGRHTLVAIGFTPDGVQLMSASRDFEFVSADAAWEAAGSIALPIVVGVLVLVGVGTLATALLGRKRVFKLGEYGTAGGAVCPRCARPYSRNVFSPNLLVGKLERCPHCGKWAIVGRASPQALAEAEARMRAESEADAKADLGRSESDRDRLRRMIDESRFED